MERNLGGMIRKLVLLSVILAAVTVGRAAPVLAETVSEETEFEAPSSVSAEKKSGWYKEDGKKYYYKDGKKLKGWQKIKGETYYLTKENGLLKNTIAGSKKNGYAYVDTDGVRVKDKQMKLAVEFVIKNSKASHSPKKRLKECFKVLCRYSYIRYYGDKPAPEAVPGYAKDLLKKKGGNCYRYASAYAYLARALGYKVRVAIGGTTAFRRRSLSPHGWCEVKIKDTWYIVDCSMKLHNPSANLCLVKRSDYPFKLRCDRVFTMKIEDHQIRWTGKKAPWNNLSSGHLRLH